MILLKCYLIHKIKSIQRKYTNFSITIIAVSSLLLLTLLVLYLFVSFLSVNRDLTEDLPSIIEITNAMIPFTVFALCLLVFVSPDTPNFTPYRRLPINDNFILWVLLAESIMRPMKLVLTISSLSIIVYSFTKSLISVRSIVHIAISATLLTSVYFVLLTVRLLDLPFWSKLLIITATGTSMYLMVRMNYSFIPSQTCALLGTLGVFTASVLLLKHVAVRHLKYLEA